MRRLLRLATASAALLLGACSDPATAPEADPATARYATSLNINIADMKTTRPSGGVYFIDDNVGGGTAAVPGARVLVHYTGWLADGTRFDTSRDGDGPIDFVLGSGRVIQGWDEGIAGMKVGGRRRLVIPPSLGYGQSGFNGIPGNAILVFEVELVNIV